MDPRTTKPNESRLYRQLGVSEWRWDEVELTGPCHSSSARGRRLRVSSRVGDTFSTEVETHTTPVRPTTFGP